MLNMIPAPLARPKPPLPGRAGKKRAAPHKCRRGGQPGNSNARKHGLYAARNPHPESRTLHKIERIRAQPFQSLDALQAALVAVAVIMDHALGMMKLKKNRNAFTLGLAILNRALKSFNALTKQKSAILLAYYRVKNLARDAFLLVQWEFLDRRIPEHTLFVPLGFENFRANLSAGCPILTDAQWFLMQETFRTLREDLDGFRKYKRHKARHNPRFLMQGILLKLAFGVKWDAVPKLIQILRPQVAVFPVRAAQQLYRQLYLSGRLQAIYEQMHCHLHGCGDTTLEDLAEQGCFWIENNRVRLALHQKLTWQKFTALLLLQRALFIQRTVEREQTLERRAQGRYLRLPSPRLMTPKYDTHPSAFTLSPVVEEKDMAFEPLEKSLAWKKWQPQEKINDIGRIRSPDT